MVGFDYDLSKKYIPIGSAADAIDLPNGAIIANLNDNPLLHRGDNYLLYKPHERWFGASVHAVSTCHGGRQYTHADRRVINMKFDKYLIYVPIQ